MTNKDNGGPAFPTVEANYHNENMRSEGISIRDYFAAKAMQALVSQISWQPLTISTRAYEIADAMLKERAK